MEVKKLLGCLTVALACMLLLRPQVVSVGVSNGLHICANAILPSLFPFFVLTEFWIQAGYTQRLSALAAPLTKRLFHLPGAAASAVLLGMLGGYPMGAKTVASLYKRRLLTKEEAENSLFFCCSAEAAFLVGVIGVGIFQRTLVGLVLYVIHIASAFLVGLSVRPKTYEDKPAVMTEDTPLSEAIVSSIRQGGMTTISVCIFVMFFSVLGELCSAHVLPSGLLELSKGADLLAKWDYPVQTKAILSSGFVGFGGVCVLVQTVSILREAGLSCKTYCIGKLLQAIISMVLTWITLPFLPPSEPCFAPSVPAFDLALPQTMSCLLLLLVFVKISSGKTQRNRI